MYNKDRTWDHVEELMEFFRTFANDRRFGEFKQLMIDESRKGEVTMCNLLDAFEKDGMEKGRYNSLEKLMKKTGMMWYKKS